MNAPETHIRVLCAAAAVLLTALSSTLFVPEPTNLDRRPEAAGTVAAIQADHAAFRG